MTKMQHALKPLGAFVAGCALALACVLGFASSAEAQTESVGWSVAYNADKQMVSDYDRAAMMRSSQICSQATASPCR